PLFRSRAARHRGRGRALGLPHRHPLRRAPGRMAGPQRPCRAHDPAPGHGPRDRRRPGHGHGDCRGRIAPGPYRESSMGFLQGKRALITGIASQRSIANGIAEAMHREGAELAFTYQNEKLKSRVEEAAAKLGGGPSFPLDVTDDAQIAAMYEQLGLHWSDGFDILVHAIAFAPREAITGGFLDGPIRENFAQAHDISTYSLAALAKCVRPLMQGRQGAVLTLSYLGAVRTLHSYNVLGVAKAALEASVRYLALNLGPEGIRVNAISAGPIKTLAAAGIGGFRKILGHVEANAPIRRTVTIEDVGNAAAFLCSDLASGITGEVTYVDGGYSIVG